jgi:hypothetical protein
MLTRYAAFRKIPRSAVAYRSFGGATHALSDRRYQFVILSPVGTTPPGLLAVQHTVTEAENGASGDAGRLCGQVLAGQVLAGQVLAGHAMPGRASAPSR